MHILDIIIIMYNRLYIIPNPNWLEMGHWKVGLISQ